MSCHVYYFGLSPLFTLVFSFMMAKSERLISIFKAKTRFSRRDIMINKSKTYSLILVTISVDILITTVVYMQNDQIIEVEYAPEHLKKEIYCTGKDLIYFKSFYDFLILLVSSIQAFRSRNLPPRYNEAWSLLFINVCSFAILLLSNIAMKYHAFKGMKYSIYLSLGISISNINILLSTFYLKFLKYVISDKRTKNGINLEGFLKKYEIELLLLLLLIDIYTG